MDMQINCKNLNMYYEDLKKLSFIVNEKNNKPIKLKFLNKY